MKAYAHQVRMWRASQNHRAMACMSLPIELIPQAVWHDPNLTKISRTRWATTGYCTECGSRRNITMHGASWCCWFSRDALMNLDKMSTSHGDQPAALRQLLQCMASQISSWSISEGLSRHDVPSQWLLHKDGQHAASIRDRMIDFCHDVANSCSSKLTVLA